MLAKLEPTNRWIDLWLTEVCNSANSLESYRREIMRFREIVPKPLPEVTRDDLIEFRASLADLSARSRNHAMATIASLFKFVCACEPAYLPRNVAASIRPEKFTPGKRPVPTEREVADAIDGELDPLNRLALRMLYFSGCRASELGSIHWADIEPSGALTIHAKGGKVNDSEIPVSLYQDLQRERGGFDPPIPLDRHELYRLVRRVGKRLGIADLSPHCFRHACGTHLARAGCPIHLVKEHLGHSRITTTQIYFDKLPDDQVTSRLEEAIR